MLVRAQFGAKVAAQLEQTVGSLRGLAVDIHAGAAYVEAVDGSLRAEGAEVIDQLKSLSFGRRLSR